MGILGSREDLARSHFLAVNEDFLLSRVSFQCVSLPPFFPGREIFIGGHCWKTQQIGDSHKCHLFPFVQKTTELLWGAGSHYSALCVALDLI